MHRAFTYNDSLVKKTLRSISALMLREMSTTYGRTPGGYLWAVLEPVAGIALLTFVFSLAFHAPPLGDNFPMFYASGLLVYTLYVQCNTKLMVAIWFSKPLLQYPTVSFIDALIGRFLLTVLTHVIVFYAVIAGIVLIYDPHIRLRPDLIVLSLAMTATFGAGIGVLNCLLITRAPVWQRIWNIAHRPMFLISGVLFVFEAVPHPYREVLWFNPLIHVIGMMRRAFYPTYDAAYVSPAYVFGLGLALLVVGLFFLRRWHKDLAYG